MKTGPRPSLSSTLARLVIVLLSVLGTGCAGNLPYAPVAFGIRAPTQFGQAEDALKAGVQLYESGRYDASTTELSRALDFGLRTSAEIVRARKYLAFIYCATGNPNKCRGEFREALRIDPNFELDKAEAGHPKWGPVFIEVRKDFAARRR